MIAGIVVLAWPFDSIALLALVVGVWLLVIGIAQIVSAFQARKAANSIGRGIESWEHAAA